MWHRLREVNTEIEILPHLHNCVWGFSYSGECSDPKLIKPLGILRGCFFRSLDEIKWRAVGIIKRHQLSSNRPRLHKRPRLIKKRPRLNRG